MFVSFPVSSKMGREAKGVIIVMVVMLWLSSTSEGEKVRVDLYYESLCPYCQDFIVNRFVRVFNDKQLLSIVDLRLVPWGNSFLQSDGSFICQHGPNECFFNTVEACAIALYPDVERHFRFVHCVERKGVENRMEEWVNCFQVAAIGREPIDCYTSGYGNRIEQQFAAETAQLNPSHRFVPWIVVNNQPLQEDFENFVRYICKAYRGSEVPDACKSQPYDQTSNLWDPNAVAVGVCLANFTSSPNAP